MTAFEGLVTQRTGALGSVRGHGGVLLSDEPNSQDFVRFSFCNETEVMGDERELIDTGTDKRHVRRDDDGTFKESDDVGKSLATDVKQYAKAKKPKNQGDKGD